MESVREDKRSTKYFGVGGGSKQVRDTREGSENQRRGKITFSETGGRKDRKCEDIF